VSASHARLNPGAGEGEVVHALELAVMPTRYGMISEEETARRRARQVGRDRGPAGIAGTAKPYGAQSQRMRESVPARSAVTNARRLIGCRSASARFSTTHLNVECAESADTQEKRRASAQQATGRKVQP